LEISARQFATAAPGIEQRDGVLRAPWGETMTRDAFEAARSGSATVVILPDNCRDAVVAAVRHSLSTK
jgi:hypothetical protein